MKSIVTGGLGFIGGHLVEQLAALGHMVVALDYIPAGTKRKIDKVKHKNVSYHDVDITKAELIDNPIFKDVDWVFHLAGRSDIVPSITNPVAYHAVNVTGTVHVLEAARKNCVKRFVYAASSSCYGFPDVFPTSETAQVKPEYPYALTKWMGEQYVLHWARVYKLPTISLRFFNVFGPRSRVSDDYGPVFSTFIPQLLASAPFTVVGDGSQSRDFTFVTDVADACISAASSDVVGEVFNVGSGGTYTINHLVKLLGGGNVVNMPKRPGEPDKTHADITKIKKMLGWKPKISFEEGVKIVLSQKEYWKNAPVWSAIDIQKATKDWFTYLSK